MIGCAQKKGVPNQEDLNYLETNRSQVIYNSEQHLSIMIYYCSNPTDLQYLGKIDQQPTVRNVMDSWSLNIIGV